VIVVGGTGVTAVAPGGERSLMAISEDIADQAENAGCVVVY
jgi:hypothetical protein